MFENCFALYIQHDLKIMLKFKNITCLFVIAKLLQDCSTLNYYTAVTCETYSEAIKIYSVLTALLAVTV